MFHFTIKHVAGKSFGPDGLSRREVQPGDKEYPPDKDSGETNLIPNIVLTKGIPPPLEFDDIKLTRGVGIFRQWPHQSIVLKMNWIEQNRNTLMRKL